MNPALRSYIYQEDLPQINSANMKMLGIIFTAIPGRNIHAKMTTEPIFPLSSSEHAALELALIFQELAANEEYIPYLRLLLGKVIKAISKTQRDMCSSL